jgi:hypothetical protein
MLMNEAAGTQGAAPSAPAAYSVFPNFSPSVSCLCCLGCSAAAGVTAGCSVALHLYVMRMGPRHSLLQSNFFRQHAQQLNLAVCTYPSCGSARHDAHSTQEVFCQPDTPFDSMPGGETRLFMYLPFCRA